MSLFPQDPATEPSASFARQDVAGIDPSLVRWIAGVRYPGGTEIWCAERAGEAAWTTDRKLATTFPSAPNAAMAAHLLADDGAVAFWTSAEG
jgi:hypothetical protein